MGKKKTKRSKESPPPPQQRPPDPTRVANLAKAALDAKHRLPQEEIEAQIEQLTTEEAAIFVRILEITLKRRRAQMLGYIAAMISVVLGMLFALYMWGRHEKGTFIGWVFVIPPATAGLCLWLFGRWANRIKG